MQIVPALLHIVTAAACLTVVAESLETASFRADAHSSPVSKVVNVLKDMLKQLEKEAEEDEKAYDTLACWCETNDKEKTKSIADAERRVDDLSNSIEELSASSDRLGEEIATLKKEVSKNQNALDQATAIRRKQLAQFNAEESSLLESISALKAAVAVLSKHHKSSLLQIPRSHLMSVATTLEHEMKKNAPLLQGVLTYSERKAANSFIQAPDNYFEAEPTFKQSYAPQSGEIFGILKQMMESFESNLEAAQKEEQRNGKSYEEVKGGKNEELDAGQAQIDSKTDELATTDDKLAHSKEDLADTKKSLAADQDFLTKLKEKCALTDSEWEQRQKTRQLEMEAVSKATAVLNSDDAHATFGRTFNPTLLQTHSAQHASVRKTASDLLSAVAKKVNNPRLASLALKVRLDAFTRVKKAIDDMVAQLLKEKEDEIKHKDFCVDEFNSNQLQTEKKERKEQDLTNKIDDLELAIKELTQSIDKLKLEVSEMQVQLKRAGEDREKANKEFQMTVADQRETQKLLKAAIGILQSFYGKKASLLQMHEPAGPAPPPGFKAYEKNTASDGVMGMLNQIMTDSKDMEAEALRAESDAQEAYESFVKETNRSVNTKSKEIVNKSEERAKKEGSLVEKKEEKEAVNIELEQLSNYNAELHASCDFVMKNFDLRQAARDEEVSALRQAKAILSGAKFSDFLQA